MPLLKFSQECLHKLHCCPTISEKREKRRFNRCVHASSSDRVKTLEVNPSSDDKLGKSGTRGKKIEEKAALRDAPLLSDIFLTRICVTRICVTRLSNAICPSCSRITWISISPELERRPPRKGGRGKSRGC